MKTKSKNNKIKLFNTPLSKFNFPAKTLGNLTKKVFQHTSWPETPAEIKKLSQAKQHLWWRAQQGAVTVKMVMDAWDAIPSARGWIRTMPKDKEGYGRKETAYGTDASMREFIEALVSAGYDAFDWVHICPESVDFGQLKALGKKRLLKMSILFLGNFSGRAWKAIEHTFKKPVREVTIGELLATGEFKKDEYSSTYKPGEGWQASYGRTTRLLRALGITEADGPFMPQGYEERRLALSEKLWQSGIKNHTVIEKVIRFAENENWVQLHS